MPLSSRLRVKSPSRYCVSKEVIEKLFKSFQQVDTSTTHRCGGTGLGLVISKRLAEYMGGTIWVEVILALDPPSFFP